MHLHFFYNYVLYTFYILGIIGRFLYIHTTGKDNKNRIFAVSQPLHFRGNVNVDWTVRTVIVRDDLSKMNDIYWENGLHVSCIAPDLLASP